MVAVLIFNHVPRLLILAKTTLGKLVAMATKKRLSLTYELENFVNTYLGKVTKFQVDGWFCFGVLSNLLAWRWKTPPPPRANRVKQELNRVFGYQSS